MGDTGYSKTKCLMFMCVCVTVSVAVTMCVLDVSCSRFHHRQQLYERKKRITRKTNKNVPNDFSIRLILVFIFFIFLIELELVLIDPRPENWLNSQMPCIESPSFSLIRFCLHKWFRTSNALEMHPMSSQQTFQNSFCSKKNINLMLRLLPLMHFQIN